MLFVSFQECSSPTNVSLRDFSPIFNEITCLYFGRLSPVWHKVEGAPTFHIFNIVGNNSLNQLRCILCLKLGVMKCQLWVSIYQARGLISQDKTGKNGE